MPVSNAPVGRQYSPEFKAKLVAACKKPGGSVAAVSMAHGVNANVLHRWCREYEHGYVWRNPAEKGKYRSYSDEFKRMIAAQCQQPGATATTVARINGLNPNLVGTWFKKLSAALLPSSTTPGSVADAVELLPVIVAEEQALPSVPRQAQPRATNRPTTRKQFAGHPAYSASLKPGQIDIELEGARIQLRGAVDPQVLRMVLEALRR